MKPTNYLILLVLPAMVVAGYFAGGWWNFLVPVCCFAAYPVANLFVSSAEDHAHAQQTYAVSAYRNIALIFVPVLLALTVWCVYTVSKTKMNYVEYAGLCLSLGIVNSILGFTLAHEFIHRFTKTERLAGYLLLLQNNYMHYGIEHVWGHHVYACTPEDPHTARIGESIYRFLPRAIWLTYKNAFRIEAKRLTVSRPKTKFFHNRIVMFGMLQIALVLSIFFFGGLYACVFFILQNVVAILLLHIINYMQHYGLRRVEIVTGNYEKLNAHHAWNTGRTNSTVNLFQLENHADHHMHPNRRFEKLEHREDSPEYPAGYSFMVLLSLVPPLWFKIMNKRIPSNLLNRQL
jgi:alkane 1-monooxygenase